MADNNIDFFDDQAEDFFNSKAFKNLPKKFRKKIRKQVESKRDTSNEFIDSASLSDQDVQGIIDQLSKRVGTQVSQEQNRTADLLQDAPEATKVAAGRSAAISGNEAVTGAVPKIKLAQKSSQIDAFKNIFQSNLEQERFKEQQKLQEESNLMNLFTSIGTTLGSELLFPGAGVSEDIFQGFGS